MQGNTKRTPASLVLAAVGILLLTHAFLQVSQQQQAYANSTPSISTINTAATPNKGADITEFNVTENTTTALYIHGTASDADGCETLDTITNWKTVVYRSDISGTDTCTADNNNCYQVDEPTSLGFSGCTGAEDTDLDYEAVINIQYYADATDTGSPNAGTNWTAYILAGDDASATDTATDSFEMNSLIATGVGATISFGTLALNTDSSEIPLTITNTGNRSIDLDQTGDGDMICNGEGSSNIPVENIHFSLSTGFAYAAGTAMGGVSPDPAVNIDISVAARTDDATESTSSIYHILRIPETGLRGTCSNIITFTAKQG
jgi:hypothetical protein